MGKRAIGILQELMVIVLLLSLFIGVVLTAAGFRPAVRKPDTLKAFAAVAIGDFSEER